MASQVGASTEASTAEPLEAARRTTVSWEIVAKAWHARKTDEELRRTWIAQQRQQSRPSSAAQASSSDPPSAASQPIPELDEVVERIKADKTLDPHERRLLGCIVDVASMPTTFASVHLPVKTIDAIRTMVSLPLLYPQAFQQGILKTHSMNGALLMGPPGVGKTLLARAVARESGARMLVVKPSGTPSSSAIYSLLMIIWNQMLWTWYVESSLLGCDSFLI